MRRATALLRARRLRRSPVYGGHCEKKWEDADVRHLGNFQDKMRR